MLGEGGEGGGGSAAAAAAGRSERRLGGRGDRDRSLKGNGERLGGWGRVSKGRKGRVGGWPPTAGWEGGEKNTKY